MAVTEYGVLVSPLDARDQAGNVLTWPWLEGSDDQVAIDIGGNLDTGETLLAGEVTRVLYRIALDGRSNDEEDVSDSLSGAATVSGSVILQRLVDLERGRNYRLEVLHGPAGNKRGASLLIHCAG